MTEHNAPLVDAASRPHPARSDKSLYPVTGLALARYGDMDANGHVNNLALESMHENARAEFNERVFPGIYDPSTRTVRLVTANNVVHFLAEVHWPVTIATGLGIGRIGRTSFVACTALFVGDSCVGLCDTVLVMLDDDGPTPIPDAARDLLAANLL